MNLLALFSNAFGPDAIVIFLVLLLLFGAKKLPELARGLGQSLNEFRRAKDDFDHEIQQAQPDLSIREAKERQARVTPGTPTAQELQRQVEELQEQLRVAQQAQQSPKLMGPSSSTDEVVQEPSHSVRPS
jgi:sec-independent protein translocase protein TatA